MAHTDPPGTTRPPRALHASGWTLSWGRRRRSRSPEQAGLRRLVLIVLGVPALVLGLSAGTAYAYFSTTASGSGNADVGTLQPVVVEQARATFGLLIPGGKAGLTLTLTNPNAFPVTLVGVTETGTATTVTVTPPSTPATACDGANAGVSLSSTVATHLPVTIPAHATHPTGFTLVIATGVVMGLTSPSACQTRAFSIPITVAVQKP